MITIEKNIPIPFMNRHHDMEQYPFFEMEVGDSFFAPLPEGIKPNRFQCYLMNAPTARAKRKDMGYKWTSRQMTENDVKGIRVWRTK